MENPDSTAAIRGDIKALALDLKSLHEVLGSTRGEIKLLATKGELKALATKEDIEQLRAVDLKKLDLKIDDTRRTLSLQIARNQVDILEIKETMATKMATKDDVDGILSAVDSFAGKAQNYDRVSALHGQVLTEVQVELKNHDKCIKRPESGS